MSAAIAAPVTSPADALRALAARFEASGRGLLVTAGPVRLDTVRVREASAMVYSSCALEVRSLAERFGDLGGGESAHWATALAAISHAERLADQHRRMVDQLNDLARALSGGTDDLLQLAEQHEVRPLADGSIDEPALQHALQRATVELLLEVSGDAAPAPADLTLGEPGNWPPATSVHHVVVVGSEG